jgi:hypothetical protein
MLIRCSAIHKIIGESKTKGETLSQTAKSHLIEQAKQELFGVAAFDGAKYTEKGNALEPFAIQGSGMIRGRQYAKNAERRENPWISGECDIHDPKHRLIIDTKCSWEIKTHPFFREEAERKVKEAGYDWQMQGYMWLFDCEQAEIDFWLFPCPEDLLPTYADPARLIDAVEAIPLRQRVTTVTVRRDEKAIERIRIKAAHCQDYYQQLLQEIQAC